MVKTHWLVVKTAILTGGTSAEILDAIMIDDSPVCGPICYDVLVLRLSGQNSYDDHIVNVWERIIDSMPCV